MGRALSGLLGNDALKKDLSLALAAGRLAHSVLLCGEQGMGAGFAARCLAADFLYPQGGAAAAAVLEGRSPEVLTLAGEGASGFIKIDAVRAVRRAIYDTSLSAAGRVVLVYGAEKLNAASANAMLKVIEEPPENVLFVFTAVSEAAVLPTIRSRCSVYTLAPLAVPECAAALERLGAKPQQARRLAEIFDGRLGEAKACLADEKRSDALALAERIVLACEKKDAYAALCLLAQDEKDRAGAKALLRLVRYVCAGALAKRAGGTVSAPRAARCAACAGEAMRLLDANANPKLVLTQLGAQLAR